VQVKLHGCALGGAALSLPTCKQGWTGLRLAGVTFGRRFYSFLTPVTGQISGEKRPSADPGKKAKNPKKKKKKDPNEPQKPVSAYALFFRDTQAAIKGQNPSATFGDVSKIVASMWDSLGEEQKQVSLDLFPSHPWGFGALEPGTGLEGVNWPSLWDQRLLPGPSLPICKWGFCPVLPLPSCVH
jgi:hypothetical protein